MATEQLPAAQYIVAGQPSLSGWEVIQADYGFEEDFEDKQDATGQQKAKITYSRRQTLSLTLEAAHGGTVHTYVAGGQIASGTLTLADGSTASAWNIRSATLGRTRGVTTMQLDLIQQADLL